ncbi:unnamed protein product, partial [Vitrella brassicaformis CCMP3155]
GNCQLPVRLTAADLHQYPNKTAYSAAPRVLAQLKMVGPHIHFGDGETFQLFHHGNILRAIKDEYGFDIDIDPPLPPIHPYQQHRQPHDPPVRSRIAYHLPEGWQSMGAGDYSSVSSFVKTIVIGHFNGTHQINCTSRPVSRHVDNHRLHTIVTQSPHTPVEECITTTSYLPLVGLRRSLVLTDACQSFVAWIAVTDVANIGQPSMAQQQGRECSATLISVLCCHSFGVRVWVMTTESAVSGVGGAFKDRFPVTTRLARAVLGAVNSAILSDGAPEPGQQPQDDSDEDSDNDDLDGDDDFDGDDDDMEDDWEDFDDEDDEDDDDEGSGGGEAAAASASASASASVSWAAS